MTLVQNYSKTTALGIFVCVVHYRMTNSSTLPFLLKKKAMARNANKQEREPSIEVIVCPLAL